MQFKPKARDFKTRVQASFANQGMMNTLQAKLEEVNAGQCIITAPIRPETGQQHGFGHAGLSFSIGDSAAGYAAFSLMDSASEVVTAEIKINLIAPAKGDYLEAIGKVIRPGNRLFTVQSDVYAIEGSIRTHVAILLGTMVAVRTA